jgi:hypothetical protein
MKKLGSFMALAFMCACVSTHHTDDQPVSGGDDGHGPQNGSGSGSGSGGAAVCPLGAPEFTSVLAPDVGSLANASLAVAAAGNAFVASAGIFDISAAGDVTAGLGFGDFVAVDAQGNLFVAGAFSSRIDFGNNIVLNPMGNVDVFIAKLDAKGKVVFAKALDLCGDGISAMVVAKDGRIAISGSAMGTVVLDANGEEVFSVAAFGKIAFDSKGDLVVAGSVDGGGMFVAMFDATGKAAFDQTIAGGDVFVGAVAIDANDHIAIVGYTTGTIDLFGTQIVAQSGQDVGRTSGAFLLVVDDACNAVMAKDLSMVEANGVAFDANGNIFVVGANTSGNTFDRLINVTEIDVRGQVNVLASVAHDNGRALALAIDACGSLFVALTHQVPNDGVNPLQLQLIKVAL